MPEDKNFDDLAQLISRRIYSGSKGRLRLAVIQRDLLEVLPQLLDEVVQPMTVLDAGGGEGWLAEQLATAGHQVTLCDISAVMLAQARERIKDKDMKGRLQLIQCPLQSLPSDTRYSLILNHAVLEWLEYPQAALETLLSLLEPGGLLSLMFYNRNATVMRSLLFGYFDRVTQEKFQGTGEGLTPTHPLLPEQVQQWIETRGYECVLKSGIRVFHDYMPTHIRRNRPEEVILRLEMQYSRQEPFRSLGRYYHIIARKPIEPLTAC